MKDIIVFEGNSETIVGDAASINDIIRDWFLNGGRSLDDYNTYLVDGSKGFSITSKTTIGDGPRMEYDVTALMPNHLRMALVDSGQLTDE